MVIWQQTAQTRYHHQASLHIIKDITLTQGITLDPPLDIITETKTGITGPDQSHIPADIEVTVVITCTEATPDHVTDALTGALHITITQALIVVTVTQHTGNHLHIEAPPLILEITADPEHVPHTNQVRLPLLCLHPVLAGQQ